METYFLIIGIYDGSTEIEEFGDRSSLIERVEEIMRNPDGAYDIRAVIRGAMLEIVPTEKVISWTVQEIAQL